jgi:hypothetical protein
MDDAFTEKTHSEGRAILRIAQDMRNFIAAAPADDPDAQSIRRDCDTLDRVGLWLSTCSSITVQDGIDAAGPGPHIWTPDETKNRCMICGDGVWGRHRFQSSDPNVTFERVS